MKQTKLKLNYKGLFALLIWLFAIGLLIYDFIQLTKGATYTWFGLSTLGVVLLMGCEAENYMIDRINKR